MWYGNCWLCLWVLQVCFQKNHSLHDKEHKRCFMWKGKQKIYSCNERHFYQLIRMQKTTIFTRFIQRSRAQFTTVLGTFFVFPSISARIFIHFEAVEWQRFFSANDENHIFPVLFSPESERPNDMRCFFNKIHHLAFNGFIFTFSEHLWHLFVRFFSVTVRHSFWRRQPSVFISMKHICSKLEFIYSVDLSMPVATKHKTLFYMQTMWWKEIEETVPFSMRMCAYGWAPWSLKFSNLDKKKWWMRTKYAGIRASQCNVCGRGTYNA